MKKILFFLSITLVLAVSSRAATVTIAQYSGTDHGTYHDYSFYFDDSGYLHYNLTVYTSTFNPTDNVDITISISSDDYPSWRFDAIWDDAAANGPFVRSGVVYMGPLNNHFLFTLAYDMYDRHEYYYGEADVTFEGVASISKKNLHKVWESIKAAGSEQSVQKRNTSLLMNSFQDNLACAIIDDRYSKYMSLKRYGV